MKKIFLFLLVSLIFTNTTFAKSNRDVLYDSLQKVKTLTSEHISTDSNVIAVNEKLKDGLISHFQGEYFFDFSNSFSSPKCRYGDIFNISDYFDYSKKNSSRIVKSSMNGYRYDMVFDDKEVVKYWIRTKSQPDECLSKNNFVNSFYRTDDNTNTASSFFYNFLNKYKNNITVQKLKDDMVAGSPTYHYKIVVKTKTYQKFSQDYLNSFKDSALEAAIAPLQFKDIFKIKLVNYEFWVDKISGFPLKTSYDMTAVGIDKKKKTNGQVVLKVKNTIDFIARQTDHKLDPGDLKANLAIPKDFVDLDASSTSIVQ
jgi:hypothetical protein